MNKDDSKQTRSCAVKSKYFTRKIAMDESLSDFQETKQSCAGPKNTAKISNSKPRKAPKRIRGQKDIRKALRPKNDLETYSEDFDKVCKKAGLDVDSEQLQLAIALSKSLQNTACTSNETSESSQTITTQERLGQIRTTLQEYGFRVPEVKIGGNTRKIRKHRKNYKLISTTDTEKKEIIANKYSQVLFQNITHCSLFHTEIDTSETPLYYLASNANYDVLKVKDTFYVSNLVEKSASAGNLLRDWSEIPGRPVSPQLFEPSNMNYSEIECSQDEIDIVLSGTLKSCKNIIRKNAKKSFSDVSCKVHDDHSNKSYENNENVKEVNKNNHEIYLEVENNCNDNKVETLSNTKPHRSCSPDIFDDDTSYTGPVFNNSSISTAEAINSSLTQNKDTKGNFQMVNISNCIQNEKLHRSTSNISKPEVFINVTKRNSNDLMELTGCIQIASKDECALFDPTILQVSHNTNVTKRKSNDFMEITECVATSSQTVKCIDLTQSFVIVEKNTEDNKADNKDCKNLDKCHKNNANPEVSTNQATNSKHLELDLTESHDSNPKSSKEIPKEVIESMDLTQSSNTSDELPFVSLTAAKDNSADDTVIVDINDYVNVTKRITNLQKEAEVHIDLTQNAEKVNVGCQSFYEDYNHDHSDSTEELRKNCSGNSGLEQIEPEKIDLTQRQERDSQFSNSFQESLKGNDVEHHINSQVGSKSENGDLTQESRKKYPRRLNSSDIIEDPVPVEEHPSNSGYKCCKPGKVDLTLSPVKQADDNEINDIDLTQSSNSSEEFRQPLSPRSDNNISKEFHANLCTQENGLAIDKNSPSCSSLGKKDDVSIDYDDFLNTEPTNNINDSKNTSSKSVVYEIDEENVKNHLNNSILSNCSQNSEVFEISDKELDYSLNQSKLEIPGGNFIFGGISIMDELSGFGASKKSIEVDDNSKADDRNEIEIESYPTVSLKNKKASRELSPIKHRRITEIATPQKACSSNIVTVVTPKNTELIIKTNNVTPMLDFESMSTPDIHKELDKYGIKPFKRKRAIQLLTHIYNQTHPIIETYTDELASPPKRHKSNNDQPALSSRKFISPRKILRSPQKVADVELNEESKSNKSKGKFNNTKVSGKDLESPKKIVPERINAYNNDVDNAPSGSKAVVFQESDVTPDIKEIECKPEDWVFQKREKAKVHSCRVPLHIAFHNYVSSRRDLREAILCYEPVEIDVIHKDMVGYGHRYDPKDLLKFLDKKCITVKTTDNDTRNQKR